MKREHHAASLAELRAFREQMDAEMLDEANLIINRFFALSSG